MLNGFCKLFQKDTLLLPIYIHAILDALIFSRLKGNFTKAVIFPIQIAFDIFAILIWAFCLIIFAFLNELVHCYLKFKYGNLYIGMLDGMSSMIACTHRPVIQIVSALEAKKSFEEVFAHFQKNGERMKEAHPVLNCIVGYELGYHFYKRIDIHISDIIKPIRGYTSAKEFNAVLDNIASSALPWNDAFLWEIYVGDTQISWPDEQGSLQIPVVLRFNHLLGDGVSIMSLCTAYLNDQGVDEAKRRCDMFASAVKKTETRNTSKLIGLYASVTSFFDLAKQKMLLNGILQPETTHVLHHCTTGNRKICTYGLDTNDGKYFRKIQAIKRKLPNLKFNDVVFTALCASLSDYINTLDLEEHSKSKPKSINFVVPYYSPTGNFDDVIDSRILQKPIINLTNKFNAAQYSIPLLDNSTKTRNKLLALLDDISKRNASILKSLDLSFFQYLMGAVFTILPVPLIRIFNKTNDGTVIISNMPGYERKQSTCGACPETDTIIWTMNLQNTGLTFLVFTHNNRLRLSLQQDCKFIKTREEGQSVIDGVYDYINQLDAELSCL